MSLLSSILSGTSSAARSNPVPIPAPPVRGKTTGSEKEDPTKKAERDALLSLVKDSEDPQERKFATEALRTLGLGTLADVYDKQSGVETPTEQLEKLKTQSMLQLFKGFQEGGTPFQVPEIPIVETGNADLDDQQRTIRQQKRQSRDILTRGALKDLYGIQIGANELYEKDWWNYYDQLVNTGELEGPALRKAAVEFGFVPDSALEARIPEEDKRVLFQTSLVQAITDKETRAKVAEVAPKGSNVSKAILAGFLVSRAGQNKYISPDYDEHLNRALALTGVENVTPEKLDWIQTNLGKDEWTLEQEDLLIATEKMQQQEVIRAGTMAYTQEAERLKAEFEAEPYKPIPSESRLKEGIPSKYQTAQELADAGYRFPTQAEKELYNDYYSIMIQMEDMEKILFGTKEHPENGIFTGIGTSFWERTKAKKGLGNAWKDGTMRGQNLEIYHDVLESFGRPLLRISNSGSSERPTDLDMIKIKASTADTGGFAGLPDSEKVARRKHQRYIALLHEKLDNLLKTTTLGLSAEGRAKPPAKPDMQSAKEALLKKYKKGGQ